MQNVQLRNKTCSRAFIALWKPRRMFGRIREQISENPRRSLTNFFVLHSDMKTHLLTNQNALTIQSILKSDLLEC